MTRLPVPPLLVAVLVACAQPGTPFPHPLPLPAEPALPRIPAAEVACLSDATWRLLVLRDWLLRSHATELRGIIQATHSPELPP